MTEQIYDIFCSYDSHSAGTIVVETSQKLISKNWDVIVDRYQKLYFNDSKKDINRSKIFLCFFTTQYSSQLICLQKLEYAKKVNKRIIIVALEKVNLNNLAKHVKSIIENAPKVVAYDQPNNLKAWFDVLFDQISVEIDIIEQMNVKTKAKYFKTTTVRQMKHDLFFSFEDDNKNLVDKLCGQLTAKELKVWFDMQHTFKDGQNLHIEVEEAILESRIVVCFMTKKYCASLHGQLELKFATTNKRKCILVLLENFDLGLAGFGMYMLGPLKLLAYEEETCLENWSQNLIDKLCSLIRKMYCQIYVKEDIKEIDETSELSNLYRKFRRIVLDCSILREKSSKFRVDYNKRNQNNLNEKQEGTLDTYLKNLDNQNRAILIHKEYVKAVSRRFEEKQKLIIEKFRVFKHETKRLSTIKSVNYIDEKKRLKLVSQELVHLFERIKFLIREQLLLLDELNLNYTEYYKLIQIKGSSFVNNENEINKTNNESEFLFKSFRQIIEKQGYLTDNSRPLDFEEVATKV